MESLMKNTHKLFFDKSACHFSNSVYQFEASKYSKNLNKEY